MVVIVNCDICNIEIKNPKISKNFYRIYKDDMMDIKGKAKVKELCIKCWKEYCKIESKYLRKLEALSKEQTKAMNKFGKFTE